MSTLLEAARAKVGALNGDTLLREMARAGVAALLIKFGSAGLSFVMFVALARAMTLEEYGHFSSGFSLAMLLAVVGSFGQRALVLRFTASYSAPEEHPLRMGVIRDGYLWVLGGLIIFGAAALAWSAIWDDTFTLPLMVGSVVMAFAIGLSEYQSSILRGIGGVTLAVAPREIFWRLIVISIAGAIYFGFAPTIGATAWLCTAGVCLILVGLVQMNLNGLTRMGGLWRAKVAFDRPAWRHAMLGLWASSIISAGAGPLAVILLGASLGPTVAGPFFAAYRTSQLLNLLLIAINLVAGPMLSRTLAKGDSVGAQRICLLSASVAGASSLLGFLILVLLGDLLMRSFGPGFEVATPALLIMSSAAVINCLAGPTGVLLQMSGHDRPLFWMLTLSNGVSMSALPFVVHHFGMAGAATVLALATSGWNVAAWLYARRRLGIDPTVLAAIWRPQPRQPESR